MKFLFLGGSDKFHPHGTCLVFQRRRGYKGRRNTHILVYMTLYARQGEADGDQDWRAHVAGAAKQTREAPSR